MKKKLVLIASLLVMLICSIIFYACSSGNAEPNSVFIRYSENADGTAFTEDWTDGQDYMGIAISTEAPRKKSDYVWVKFCGDDGQDGQNGQDGINGTDGVDGVDGVDGSDGSNGVDGADGQDGTSSYLHICYATDINGKDMTDTWVEGASLDFIGFSITTNNVSPTNPVLYKWARFSQPNEGQPIQPNFDKVIDVSISGDGYDIYTVTTGANWGYRYGCTYLYNEDGSIDAYFASVETEANELDWISYRHSFDGGKTWGNERIVLTPTKKSLDYCSTCDPAVVYFGGYYYLGYTSTLNMTGICNNLFVARSKNADGPFEKWNGHGWGGDNCQPIIYYNEDYSCWGIGEASFVELDGTLYIYYTNMSPSGDYMMVATADATNPNWPETIKERGVATPKLTDSIDVKYVEDWNKFVGIGAGERMTKDSWLGIYQSNDGFDFELVDVVRENTYSMLHNTGISSRPNGHINIEQDAGKLCVTYAYGEGWGLWNTRCQPIELVLSNSNDISVEKLKDCLADPKNRDAVIPTADRHVAMIRPEQDSYYYTTATRTFNINLYQYDTYYEKTAFTQSDVKFEVYDESVITINGYTATVVGAGRTAVVVQYHGCKYLFYVTITKDAMNSGLSTQVVDFKPVVDSYTIYYGERSRYQPQIRTRVRFADGSYTEYFCQDTDVAVSYTGYDQNVISVDAKGIVVAKQVGETIVTVSAKGMGCTVKVVVTNDMSKSFYCAGVDGEKTIDYTNLEFNSRETLKVVFGLNQTLYDYDQDENALKLTTKGEDAFFTIAYNQNIQTLVAENFNKLQITYKVPTGTSASATSFQTFFCIGDVRSPSASYQVKSQLQTDGEYHNLTIDLSQLSYWSGFINSIRMDFYDQSSVGDTLYIKSIKLLSE